MIVTEGVIDTFRARSLVNSTIRRFLEDRQFLEVPSCPAEQRCSFISIKGLHTITCTGLRQRIADNVNVAALLNVSCTSSVVFRSLHKNEDISNGSLVYSYEVILRSQLHGHRSCTGRRHRAQFCLHPEGGSVSMKDRK